jgi:hypothetical protein
VAEITMSKLYWPSWRYRRAENGGIEKRIFSGPNEIEGAGWVQSPADIGKEPEEPQALDFTGLSDDELREIAAKAGVKIDRRWGRARLEAALRREESQ